MYKHQKSIKNGKKKKVYHSNKQFFIPIIHHCNCNSYCIHMVISKNFQWKNESMVRVFKQKSSFKILFKGKKCFFSFLSFIFLTISCLESNSIDTQIVAMCWKPWTRCNDHIEWDPRKLLWPKKTCTFSKGLENTWKNLMNAIWLLLHVYN